MELRIEETVIFILSIFSVPADSCVWGDWTPFGECSTSCDEGQRLFTRKCNHMSLPGHLSVDCDGENSKYGTCILGGCPGSWSCWEDDGHCSTSCGNGTQIRRRRCDDPVPTNDGDECPGENVTNVHCNIKECPGGWSVWTTFGECSTTCDEGHQVVKRRCDNPLPGRDAAYCDGEDVQYVDCNLGGCPGRWGDWTAFGECSTSCDGGQKLFTRTCNHVSLPGHLSVACDGENYEYKTCNLGGCPGMKLHI
ncbi:coadhesin-like [Mytilus galloprovincialis]|uniref:coadhesin-like n=1 Tax=Mytilus galloprovincialis TaxID=29158 RepID=UPI003F7BBDEC